MSKKKSGHVQIIVKPKAKRLLERAAERANLPLATWIRVTALKEAQRPTA